MLIQIKPRRFSPCPAAAFPHLLPSMRQRLSLLLTLAAWLFATGSHWDLVQTFAWGKMFATYAQSMSYADAARLTFNPGNLCSVCEFVQDNQQATAETGQPAPAEAGTSKILLALAATPTVVITAPDAPVWPRRDLTVPAPPRVAPPVPPPRA